MIKSLMVALGAAFFIIGVHQSFYYGVIASYWLFALSGVCFLGIQLINKKEEEKKKAMEVSSKSKKSTGKKRKRK